MSKLTITQYANVATPKGLTAQLGQEPVLNPAGSAVTFTGTAGVSEPLHKDCVLIRICADADCSIIVGTEAEAAAVPTDLALLPAKVPEWRAVKAGQFVGVVAYS